MLSNLTIAAAGLLSALVYADTVSLVTVARQQIVDVETVEELYAAVNDPANAGATINVAPGTYTLTPMTSAGQPRPNRGSLLLQNGMRLVGGNAFVDQDGDGAWDPRDDDGDGVLDLDSQGREVFADPQTETIVDGSLLNAQVPGAGVVSGALLVVGAVEVSISNLTVRGGPHAQAAVDVRGPGNDFSNVTVRECILEQGRRGILIDATLRWGSAGASVTLNAERNVIRDHRVDHLFPAIHFGWGIHTQPGNVAGTQLAVHLRDNRFRHNKVGLLLESLGMEDGQTTVVSQGNIYEEAVLTTDAVLGNVFSGGIRIEIRDSLPRSSRRNRTYLLSIADKIWNNEGWAGLSVDGIRRTANETEFIGNEIDIELIGTQFVKLNADGSFDGLQNRETRVDGSGGDQSMRRRDILIVGANRRTGNQRNPPPGGFSGPASGNLVRLLIRGAISSLMPTSYDSTPNNFVIVDNAPGEVEISLKGSAAAFIRTNVGLQWPW